MKDFKGKTAVVTGAASGIGRAIAERCVAEGMRVVLADVERAAVERVVSDLKLRGADVLAAEADVSKASDLEKLACKSLDAYGVVHLLFNNAGVAAGGPIWESSLAQCEWGIGVNLWGVIHGLRTFIPIMLKQETECHIVNTASTAGFGSSHPSAIYQLTKHAVVALSESAYHHLHERKAKIQVSVLCPGWVNTRILESERNAPAGARGCSAEDGEMEAMRQMIANAQTPAAVAEKVFRAIEDEKFYIFTDSAFQAAIRTRCEGIMEARNPVPDVLPSLQQQ